MPVPHYTVLSRRAAKLEEHLPRLSKLQGPIDIVVDGTGLKVYGSGEWQVRQHEKGKRRTWMKLHLGIDASSQQIVAQTLTDNIARRQ